MSYSRWSWSTWYSFWNGGNSGSSKDEQILSLWYSMDKTIDWLYPDLIDITAEDIQRRYDCDIEESHEAMTYVNRFIDDVKNKFESVK
jgi:hypothetical protein